MLLVFSTIQSPLEAVLYIVIFGAGSIAGMLLISLFLAVPLRWAARHHRLVQASAGFFSCVFGIYLGFQIWQTL